LRLHRRSKADWDAAEARIARSADKEDNEPTAPAEQSTAKKHGTRKRGNFVTTWS